MVGGDIDAFERAYPAMSALGKLIQHVGESGAGFAVKAITTWQPSCKFMVSS